MTKKIKFQIIRDAMDGSVEFKKDYTKFSIITEPENLSAKDFRNKQPRKVGILLWIDTDDYIAWYDSDEKSG